VLTPRGWSLLGASVGLYLGGRILGLVQLAVLAACAALLLLGAVLWTRTRDLDLVAERHVAERLQVGVEGRVDLSLTSRAGRTTPTLAVADAFDRGRRLARLLVPPLHTDETARAAYRIPTERRGRYFLGPLRVSVSDPFGVARRSTTLLGTEEVLVYPRLHEVAPPPEGGGDELDRDAPRVRGRPDPGGDFLTLREYQPGDDLRRVHWRSTARRDTLMVRQGELRRRAPAVVLLDVRPAAHDRRSFEVAVEACASIVAAIERAGRPVDVVTSAGVPIGNPGQRHLASVLDELAVIEPGGPNRFFARRGRRTPSLVAITGSLARDDFAALSVLVRGGGLLTVVATRADATLQLPPRRDVLAATVTPDVPFTTAWSDAVLRWQRSALRLHPLSHWAG
jgi:uncharacterized protein (DUF58 family)